MTIESTTNKIIYDCNGSATVFSFPYYFFQNADLKVYLYNELTEEETLLTITTHYTVTGAGNLAGGSITTVSTYSADYKIIILREVAITQGYDHVDNEAFQAESLEAVYDRLTMIAQQLSEKINRSILLPVTSLISGLSVPDPQANKVLAWNAAADALVNGPTANDIASAQSYAATAAADAAAADASADAAAASASTIDLPSKSTTDVDLALVVNDAGEYEFVYPGRRSVIINGDMDVCQRHGSGGSQAVNADGTVYHGPDRFSATIASGMAVTANIHHSTTVPTGKFGHSCRLEITGADTSIGADDRVRLRYVIMGYDIRKLMGRYCCLQFLVRSGITGIHCVSFRNNGIDRSLIKEYTINAANTWQLVEVPFQMHDGQSGTWNFTYEAGIYIDWTLAAGSNWHATKDAWQSTDKVATSAQVNGVASTHDFYLKEVQLCIGKQASDFERLPFNDTLKLCEQYYEKTYDHDTPPGTATAVYGGVRFRLTALPSASYSTALNFPFKTRKRAIPSVTVYSTNSGASGYAYDSIATTADVVATSAMVGETSAVFTATTSASKSSCDIRAHIVANAEFP
jgi:hypothetical protein